MTHYTFEEAKELIKEANTMSYEEIKRLQKERLSDMVEYAREHSKLYQEKYKHLSKNPELTDLPMVTKEELTSRMKDWICDPDFSQEALVEYLSDIQNLENPFMGKYSVLTTSGTTGVPIIMLRDNRHLTINNAIMNVRFYDGTLFGDVEEMKRKDTKYASVLAVGGFHAAYVAFEKTKKQLEKECISNTMELLSIGEKVSDMVSRLNQYQPEIITGYPSALEVLSVEQLEGRLKIKPKGIICSAEQLTEHTWELLSNRFQCPVGNVFCSTEGGEIALLCKNGHMHANVDWIIIEPIDKDGNPTKPGEMSVAILITNLANTVQPFIRYRVDDCVVLHHDKCGCGLSLPYIDILGRTDDIPEFWGKGDKSVRFSPILYLNAVGDVEGIASFQFAQTSPTSLIMRVIYLENTDIEDINRELFRKIRSILDENELSNVTFEIRNEEPARAKKGQKKRAVVKEF